LPVNSPDLAAAAETPLGPLITKQLWASIAPGVRDQGGKRELSITTAESDIEVTLDRGKITAGNKSAEISSHLKKSCVAAAASARRGSPAEPQSRGAKHQNAVAPRYCDDYFAAAA
jgi:hypothetical protein